MKKVIFVLIILLLAGCSNVQHDKDLGESFLSVIKDKNNSEVSLKSLTTFEWEKAFLFTPYTPQEAIDEKLGVDYNDPSNIDFRDDIFLLVFMNDGKAGPYVELERHDGAYFTIGEKEYLTPSDDVIVIEGGQSP